METVKGYVRFVPTMNFTSNTTAVRSLQFMILLKMIIAVKLIA